MAKFLTLAQLQKEFGVTLQSLRELMRKEIYEPLKSIADQAKAMADSVRRDADEGRFDGAPGPQGPKGEPGDVSEAELTGKLAEKVDKVSGKGLSSNDYTDADRAKVTGLPDSFVSSVNGRSGAVVLDAEDVGARADDWMPTAAQVGARDAAATLGTSDLAPGAVTELYTISIAADDAWTQDEGAVYLDKTAAWVADGDTVIVDCLPDADSWVESVGRMNEWAKLITVEISDGKLRFVATAAFETAVDVRCMKVKR